MVVLQYKIKKIYRDIVELINRIKKLLKWIPILWNQNDEHYLFSVTVFKEQLINLANRCERLDYDYHYHRIETIVKLIDKVYNFEYLKSHIADMKEEYGDFELIFEIGQDGELYVITAWDDKLNYSDEEKKMLNKIHTSRFEKSKRIHNKAHKLLWKLVEHNIQKWQM